MGELMLVVTHRRKPASQCGWSALVLGEPIGEGRRTVAEKAVSTFDAHRLLWHEFTTASACWDSLSGA